CRLACGACDALRGIGPWRPIAWRWRASWWREWQSFPWSFLKVGRCVNSEYKYRMTLHKVIASRKYVYRNYLCAVLQKKNKLIPIVCFAPVLWRALTLNYSLVVLAIILDERASTTICFSQRT